MKNGLVLALLSTSLLAACQSVPGPMTTSRLNLAPQINRQTAARPARALAKQELKTFQQPMPVQVEPDRLIFEGTQHDIRPQMILMGRSTSNQDFLRRVRQIRPSGSRLIVETTPATLFDAFSELDLSGSLTVRAPEVITLRSHRFNIGGVVDIVLDLGLKPDFSDAELKLKDSRLKVRVAPRFEIDAKVRSEYRFLGLPAQADVPLKPVGSVSFNAVRFPAWIGPVPLMFHLKPGAGLDYGHRADGRLLAATEISGEFKASVEMEAALGEAPVTRTDSEYRFDGKMLPPELRLTGSARARLHLPTVHLDTEIAGLVGPFVQAGPYVDGNFTRRLTVTPQQTTVFTSATSHLGLAIDGGITPTRLFGKELARELRFRILDKRIKELYRKESTDTLPTNP